MNRPFHLAFPVHDLDAARAFYTGVLGCPEGRSAAHWVDFDLYGHQIVAHLTTQPSRPEFSHTVDGDQVPVPHFGVVLDMAEWQALAERLHLRDVRFLLEPRVRFLNSPGEQATLFVTDPSGNAIEFKAFADPDRLFAR